MGIRSTLKAREPHQTTKASNKIHFQGSQRCAYDSIISEIAPFETARYIQGKSLNDHASNSKWFVDSRLNLERLSDVHGYESRSSQNNNYCLPTIRSNIGRNSFGYMGPKIWSEIELSTKNMPLKSFKFKLTKTMIELYDDT